MKTTMTLWGVGPRLALVTAIYCLIVAAISRIDPPLFRLDLIPFTLLMITGWTLIATGIPFLLVAVTAMRRALTEGKLVTTGVFGLCRNPIYAAWVVFLLPGLALLLNSWLFLTVPAVMYFLVRRFVRDEERDLASAFGEEYASYKQRVPMIFPLGGITTNRKENK